MAPKKASKTQNKKPVTDSMVQIREAQFDKFFETLETFDYQSDEFNTFIQIEIIDKRIASKYWLKHLRDCYAKVLLDIMKSYHIK